MKDAQSFWDERYAAVEFAYGKRPNAFFADQLQKLTPGKMLLPAEGEGRNAVHAALHGWEVHAFDMSAEGRKKALALAQEHNVTINYAVANAEQVTYEPEYFDCIALIYAHFPAEIHANVHQQMIRFLKPGGTILLESFSKAQLKYQELHNSGGPKDGAMLFSEEEIKAEFAGMQFTLLTTGEVPLAEGRYHEGPASVVRFVANKPF